MIVANKYALNRAKYIYKESEDYGFISAVVGALASVGSAIWAGVKTVGSLALAGIKTLGGAVLSGASIVGSLVVEGGKALFTPAKKAVEWTIDAGTSLWEATPAFIKEPVKGAWKVTTNVLKGQLQQTLINQIQPRTYASKINTIRTGVPSAGNPNIPYRAEVTQAGFRILPIQRRGGMFSGLLPYILIGGGILLLALLLKPSTPSIIPMPVFYRR